MAIGVHLIVTFTKTGEEGGGGHVTANHCTLFILIKYLVHKLPKIVTRFFVSFIQVFVLFKISVLKNIFPFVLNITNLLRLL